MANDNQALYYIVATNKKSAKRTFVTYPCDFKTANIIIGKMTPHEKRTLSIVPMDLSVIDERLSQIRERIESEIVSYSEIHELQEYLKPYISADDVVLLELAGVPEFAND